jgi:hypothetical protein
MLRFVYLRPLSNLINQNIGFNVQLVRFSSTETTKNKSQDDFNMREKQKIDLLNENELKKEEEEIEKELIPTKYNIEMTIKAPDDSTSTLKDPAYAGLDKTKPYYEKKAEEVKHKAESLKNVPVDEHKLKPEGGFHVVEQEVGFEHRKNTLREETGTGNERMKNEVPDNLRKEEGGFDKAKVVAKEIFEKVKDSVENVVEKVKETATEIAEKGEEKELKKRFEKNISPSKEVKKKVDSNLGAKFFDS